MGGSPPPHAGVRGRSPRETVVPIYEKKVVVLVVVVEVVIVVVAVIVVVVVLV